MSGRRHVRVVQVRQFRDEGGHPDQGEDAAHQWANPEPEQGYDQGEYGPCPGGGQPGRRLPPLSASSSSVITSEAYE